MLTSCLRAFIRERIERIAWEGERLPKFLQGREKLFHCQKTLMHDEDMQAVFVQAINQVIGGKVEIIDICEKALNLQTEQATCQSRLTSFRPGWKSYLNSFNDLRWIRRNT